MMTTVQRSSVCATVPLLPPSCTCFVRCLLYAGVFSGRSTIWRKSLSLLLTATDRPGAEPAESVPASPFEAADAVKIHKQQRALDLGLQLRSEATWWDPCDSNVCILTWSEWRQ